MQQTIIGADSTGVAGEKDFFRFGFVMEQTLGHVTHYTNLRAGVDAEGNVEASWYPLTFTPQHWSERLPLLRSNWSARASVRARRALAHGRASDHDALFFHTQVTTLLCAPLMRRVPTVISLDATPINYDSIGAAYGHQPAPRALERIKLSLNMRSLHAASAFVTWCEWARQSLISDYGIDGSRVSVISPGVNLDLWPSPAPRTNPTPVRILFVGGDFTRKGGEILLHAFTHLNRTCELHIVTKAQIDPAPGIYVYHDVHPNSTVLRQLFATADIFVLPTLADTVALVIQEAMAAGLPVIASDVGAIHEAVRSGETGFLVPPNDVRAFRAALDVLVNDKERRQVMGRRALEIARQRFDSAANARRILGILKNVVTEYNRAQREIEPTRSAQGSL